MKIGIFGGTFNPVHIGHLSVAAEIKQDFLLDKIIFIPTYIPPHKSVQFNVKPEDRLKMLKLSIKNNPYFELSNREIARKGTSYTIDTLKELKSIYPDSLFYLILGDELAKEFDTWKDYQEILRLAKLIIINRTDAPIKIKELKNYKKYSPQVLVSISSSLIRQRISENKDFRYLVPAEVYKYIIKNGLYRDTTKNA